MWDDRNRADERLSKVTDGRQGPEAARPDDAAPQTLPTIPAIRSAHLTTDQPHAHPAEKSPPQRVPSRALTPAQQDVQRDMRAVLAEPANPPRPPTGTPPMIITGDGRAPSVRPVVAIGAPRSRAMRVTFLSFALCIFLTVLLASTPLTAGATGQVGNFIAGSNVWQYPTATPTVTPTPSPAPATGGGPGTGANPGSAAIIAEIQAVFGGYSAGALGVARCESGYDPNAWNGISIMGSHAEGVFQILYPSTWDNTSYASYSPYNAWANIHAAYQIFSRDGFTWREWECQP